MYTVRFIHPYQIQAAKDLASKSLCNKPKWLSWITYEGAWVTFFGRVYIPITVNSFTPESKAVMAHEGFHLLQQSTQGQVWWLVKYLLSKKFRLDQEAQAIAVEIHETRDLDAQCNLLCVYSRALSSKAYHHAAANVIEALEALNKYLQVI